MAVAEPPGDFGYLLDEVDDTDEDSGSDDDFDDGYFDHDPYQPRPPWYRTTPAVAAIAERNRASVFSCRALR